MAPEARARKDDRLNLRVSRRQRELITEAADVAHKDLSSFVLDAALARAEEVITDRRMYLLSDEQWEQFERILERPVTPLAEKPRLARLLRQPSVLE
jgi:uncharacterized protein (DUF1778 family)